MDSIILDIFLNADIISCILGDKKTEFSPSVESQRKYLNNNLSEEMREKLRKYEFELERHFYSIRDEECMKAFFIGLDIGRDWERMIYKMREG